MDLTVKKWEVNRSGNIIITTSCPNCKTCETYSLEKFLNLPKYIRCYVCEIDLSTTDCIKKLYELKGGGGLA